jgi:hypothetical protein
LKEMLTFPRVIWWKLRVFMQSTIHPDRFNRTRLVREQAGRAFTLVELLVVMGTLALLASAAWDLRRGMRESIHFLTSTGSAHLSHLNAYSFPARRLKSLSGPAIVVSNTTKRVVAPLTDKSHLRGLQSRHESGQDVAVSTAGVVSKPGNPETRNFGQSPGHKWLKTETDDDNAFQDERTESGQESRSKRDYIL